MYEGLNEMFPESGPSSIQHGRLTPHLQDPPWTWDASPGGGLDWRQSPTEQHGNSGSHSHAWLFIAYSRGSALCVVTFPAQIKLPQGNVGQGREFGTLCVFTLVHGQKWDGHQLFNWFTVISDTPEKWSCKYFGMTSVCGLWLLSRL